MAFQAFKLLYLGIVLTESYWWSRDGLGPLQPRRRVDAAMDSTP